VLDNTPSFRYLPNKPRLFSLSQSPHGDCYNGLRWLTGLGGSPTLLIDV